MFNPVTTTAGVTYEKKNIETYLQNHDDDYSSHKPLTDKTLTPNIQLQQELTQYHLASDANLYEAITSGNVQLLTQSNFEEGCFDKVCDVPENRTRASFLHIAIYEKPEIIKYMLQQQVDPNPIDCSLNTPLHYAVDDLFIKDEAKLESRIQMIHLLVAAGADVNAQNNYGRTPLHQAAQCRHAKQFISTLLQYGADPNIKDKDGSTPQELGYEISDLFSAHTHDMRIGPHNIKLLQDTCKSLQDSQSALMGQVEHLTSSITGLLEIVKLQQQKIETLQVNYKEQLKASAASPYSNRMFSTKPTMIETSDPAPKTLSL